MLELREPLWTIEELGTQVALALSVNYAGQANGRVRDVPDRRTIRYYTTLGLIDRPAAMRGRTALYGQRHLLQLVAIKRLQTRGLTLTELQQRLLGLPDAELQRLAELPADSEAPSPTAKSAPAPEPHAEAFWRTAPAPVAEAEVAADTSEVVLREESASERPLSLQGVRLDDDVTLLWPPARPVDPEDIEAIRTVAAPLLKLLAKRRLLRPRQERR